MSIKLCKSTYDQTKKDYISYFDQFSFPLDHFQKYAIEGIVRNNHVLVTAHTGSGKTLPAEFTINHFVQQGKKVIYTSPIKSLSNQKFHELSIQFPDITFGILTGDIKCNPEADCVIMTTEILRNALIREMYGEKDDNGDNEANNTNTKVDVGQNKNDTMSLMDFNLNIKDRVGAIIFDEVHYINDQHRGKVWEECIILSPPNVLFMMLSATIDKPEMFAQWIATTKKKDVWLTGTNHRVVPLTHYAFLHIPESVMKNISSHSYFHTIDKVNNTFTEIKTPSVSYIETNIDKYKKSKKIIQKYNISVSPKQTLNKVIKILHKEDKLPAICFVFSRKKAEEFAQSITQNLHDGDNPNNDTKKTSKVQQECIQILKTLPNYKEYSSTGEFNTMIKLLEKGIAVHHSGIIPVLREMIELLFGKGYIRLLFATETFAVGINMPTKTVLFTDIEKYDGTGNRLLLAHEYTQMAGRAGRRGLDKVGHVIHLHNLFEPPSHSEYKTMLSGKPQTLKSKFSIDYRMILRILQQDHIDTSVQQIKEFIQQSMFNNEFEKQSASIQQECMIVEDKLFFENQTTNRNLDLESLLHQYVELENNKVYYKKKQLSKYQEQLQNLKQNIITYSSKWNQDNFNANMKTYKKMYVETQELLKRQNDLKERTSFVDNEINRCIQYLIKIKSVVKLDNIYSLTKKGICMQCIQETNPSVIGEMFRQNLFEGLEVIQFVQLLSCFVDLKIPESVRLYNYNGSDPILKSRLDVLETIVIEQYNNELHSFQYIEEEDYFYQYDLIDAVKMWCDAKDEVSAKYTLQYCGEYRIFTGEFVKAILKINAIALEIEKVCDLLQLIEMKKVVHQIPEVTLKYIATNQSLYI
jgi:superfamily II RNA helicase